MQSRNLQNAYKIHSNWMCLVFSVSCLEQLVYRPAAFTKHQIQNTEHVKHLRYRGFPDFHILNWGILKALFPIKPNNQPRILLN